MAIVEGPEEAEDPAVPFLRRLKLFFAIHWRGLVVVLTPLIAITILLPFPPKPYQWCAYTLILMAVWWVTECLPLPVTSMLPIIIFPVTGIMDTRTTCKCYLNDVVVMFLASLIIAAAVEVSGLHIRLALCAIRCIGYSHYKLLFAMSAITMFVSMWITSNTAVATMMVPINFAVLKVFEDQKLLSIYETTPDGEKKASDLTTMYFCAAAFSASIGGIGTLIGTVTNLAFKGLFVETYPKAPEYLSFPLFSAFSVPYMLTMEGFMYLYLIIVHLGFMRPKSEAAKKAKLTAEGIKAAKIKVEAEYKALGKITYREIVVIILFSGSMISFFCRSPQIFTGWGDLITNYFGQKPKFLLDSALGCFICFIMFMLPATLDIFKNCSAKTIEQLPKGRIPSLLGWKQINETLPYSFMLLLGGGFALSTAARKEHSDLNGQIGNLLAHMQNFPESLLVLMLILVTIFITNFASNVAVANVIVPIAMTLATKIKKNPLKYCITCGCTASYCFMVPVGTPGNLVVQSAASIPTSKMIFTGLGPTISTIIITWFFVSFWAPVIWPEINKFPEWAQM